MSLSAGTWVSAALRTASAVEMQGVATLSGAWSRTSVTTLMTATTVANACANAMPIAALALCAVIAAVRAAGATRRTAFWNRS